MGHGGRVNDGNGGERVGRGEEESGADPGDLAGEKAQRPRESGGEWEKGPRRRGSWRPYPPRRRRGGAAGTATVPPPVGGTGKGARGRVGWAGGRGVAAQFGPGVRSRWATGPVGEEGLLLFLFLLCLFCFLFSFYLFIFFAVLFHLEVFRCFIKMCFLHHNYQCII